MAANLIRVDTTGCNLDYIVYLSTTSGGYLTVKDSGINSSFFTSNANAIVISTTSGQTLFDGNTREYIRSPKGSLSFTLTHSRWRLLNTVPYTPLGDAVLSNVVTTDLSMFGSVSNYVDFIVPNTMNVFGGFESQPLPTVHGIPVITASDITSTVAGLGSLGYLSSPGTLESNLVSTVVGLGGYGYISMSQLTSTASGLGSIGYISQATLHSTLGGLGTYGYISTSSLVSSIRGLSMIYISSSSLPSTVNGLGTEGYISMPQFTSSIIGISSIYASNIYSTITYLGGSNENQAGFYTVTTTGSNGPFASPKSIARDSLGNIYVADASNHRIRKIDPSGVVTTVAGSTAGFADGINGLLNSPKGISLSGSNIYVADTGNNRIRLIMPGVSSTVSQVMVTTLAGSTSGFANGQGTAAQFNSPYVVAIDSAGIIYVADGANHRIRKIDINSNVTTFAGSTRGFANGLGTAAQFNAPAGITVDSAGIIYVADTGNHRICKIDRSSNVTTLAGNTQGFANGQGTAALFSSPRGVAVDSAGNVYVADTLNYQIRKISATGNVTSLAGSTFGFSNAQGINAQFNLPNGIAVDSAGIIYVADYYNHLIRKIDRSSNVTTFAGSTQGFSNAQGTASQFYQPFGVAVDSAGSVYVADTGNNIIRKIDTSSNVTTLAGSTSGSANGQGTSAQFNQPYGVAVDSAGIVYVADLFNNLIRKITTELVPVTTAVITTVAGSNAGFADGANGQFNSPQGISLSGSNIYVADTGNNRIRLIMPGVSSTVSQAMVTTLAGSTIGCNNGPAASAQFNGPACMTVDSAGIIYVADSENHLIRKIDRNSNITTLAGSTAGFSNGQGTAAQFNYPYGLAVDSAGIIYVADLANNRIRKIDRSSNVTTLAGSTLGYNDGQGTSAQFYNPYGVAVDSAGIIYVADIGNNRIRKIDRSSNVTTLAGSTQGFANGQGTSAQFNQPFGVAVDSAGSVYVADRQNHRIRKIDTSSNVTTLAGSAQGCNNGQGTSAQFNGPFGVAVDSAGIIYVADYNNHLIRKIDRSSNVTTLAGSTQGSNNGLGTAAQFYRPEGLAVDSVGIVYVADKMNNQIRKITTESITTTTSVITTVAGSNAGFADGANGQFNSPQGISLSGSNIYVADTGNNRIRLIMPGVSSTVSQAMVTTLAGSTQGSANGLGTAAQFYTPNGLAFDSAGIIYLADTYNNRIRKISSSNVITLAGSTQGFVDSQGISAQFYQPTAVILDSSGNVFVADTGNNRIRKIDTGCNVTTVAGSTAGFADGVNGLLNSPKGISLSGSNIYVADTGNNRIRMVVPGVSTTTLLPATVTTLAGSTQGSANGQGIAAQFYQPFGVAVDSAGIIYVSDTGNNRIRKIDTSSNVTTLAGSTQGSADGQGSSAQFNLPTGVAVDSAGIIYVADQGNSLIRKIDINSNVTTLAGNTQGFADGQGTAAQFYNPTGIAVDSAGIVYVTDYENLRIRKIDRNSNVTTLAGGVSRGTIDGQGTAAQFNNPAGIAVNSAGIIYIVDQGSSLIRKIDRNSNVTTLAGSAYAHGFADGQGTAAQFNNPLGVAVDSAGIVYVADRINNRIRKIDISSNVTTLAGSGIVGCNNGQGTAAQFYWPSGITIDSAGIVYVAEQNNNRIRKIIQETITTTTAVITTVAGSNAGFADGANGQFNSPQGISLSGSNIYVADTGNNRIRLIMPGVSSTVSQVMVTTLAGSTSGFANGQGTSAQFNNPSGVAVDSAGIIYVADTNNNLIRKIDINSNVTTLAGSGAIGFANGQGTAAQFNRPIGITVDSAGIIYVVDFFNNRMRKIDINSNVTTLAGSTQGFANGQGSSAQFYQPSGITVDSAGIIYVADQLNNRIRKIDRNSNVTTLAGSSYGFADGQGTAAQFYNPSGVAVDSEGSVYVADQLNHRIRKIDTSSNVTTLAGSGVSGFANGQGTAAQFYNPSGVAVDSEGSVYVADMYNNRIRKIDRNSNVTTLAGSIQGFSNAQGTAARFNTPYRVAVDSAGIIYVADYGSDQIRKIIQESITTTTAVITTVAGSTAGFADGANGQFNSPQGISLSGSNIYVADTGNNRIRLIMPGVSSTVSLGMVTTLAGSTIGCNNGPAASAQFNGPACMTVDAAGIVYVADTFNNLIRKIDINSNVTTLAGSTSGFSNAQGSNAKFNYPNGLAIDSSGNVYVADTQNNRIHKIDTSSNVTTLAGSTLGYNDGQGTSAQFYNPYGVAVDSAGIIYVADIGNNRIRKIDRSSNVTTLAGSTQGFANGQGTSAQFNQPFGVAVDSAGIIYVADTTNNRIRKIDRSSNVTTLAGSAQGCNNGQGTSAQFNGPFGVAVDSAGIIYVADYNNHLIRKIDRSSNVTTFAGSTQGFSNGLGTAARFNGPSGVAIDSAGSIYVGDAGNNRIRKLTPESITTTTSVITTVAGSTAGFANGTPSNALFSSPGGILSDGSNIYVADTGNNQIRKIANEDVATVTSVITTVAGSTAGFADGANAQFNSPQGISLDGSTIYVADAGNNRIRKIVGGTVTTISGCNAGFSNGPASNALFSSPGGIIVDGSTIYVADTSNNLIRKLAFTEGCNSFAVGYVSSSTLSYTVANLTNYTSKEGLQSTTTSLSAMDSSNLLSTVQGLGQYYISTATLTSSISGVQASSASNQAAGYISSLDLNSSIAGLGTLGYISISHYISSFSNLISTGPIGYASTLDGIGSLGFISTATLVSTVEGLGSLGYISSSSPLVSTVQGLGQTYISTASLVSTMSNYISTMSNYPTSSNQSLLDVGPIVTANKAISEIFIDEYSTVSTLPFGGTKDITLFSGTACLSKSSGIVVSTVAGSTQGSANGTGTAAQFYSPRGVAVDSAGIIYIADSENNLIRKIDRNSNVTTLAGSTQGSADGQGTAAQFFKPYGIAVDSAGIIYVADSFNFRIRKIDTSSNVTTLAGSIQAFSNAQGTAAQFLNPFGVAVDSAGIVYVADYGCDQIRKIDINSNVTTLAGGIYGYADGQGTAARFIRPYDVAVDSAGIIYVADYGNNRIRKIDRNSNVTTLAGSTYGFADGQGTAAKFNPLYALAVDSAGSVYVSDANSCVIRKIDTSSNVTTFAGIVGSAGSNNGPGTSARFNFPWGVAVDSAGIIYIADSGNNQMRKIVVGSPNIITSNDNFMYFITLTPYPNLSPTQISIVSFTPVSGFDNYPKVILFSNTSTYRGITNDSINIYATCGNSILAYSILTLSNTIIANTTNTASFVNGTNASTVTFSSPSGIAIDSVRSNLYVCDTGNNSIRKVQLNPLSVTTIATITSPLGIAIDSYSTYAYVTDTGGNITRVSLLQRNSTSLIVSNLGTMYSITLDPTNTYAYVTRYTANVLTAVNLITGRMKSTGNGEQFPMDGTEATPGVIARRPSYYLPHGIVYTVGNFLYISDSGGTRKTTTQGYLSTSTALGRRATAATIAPTTTLTNQVTGQCVYMSNTSVTTTPFISLTPTTVNLTVNLYANSVTAATFTASSGTSASGLGYFFGDGTNVTTISDIRTKENIEPIEHALSTVRSLQAVEYTKIDDPSRRWLGYIAQDVEDSIPEIVTRSGEEEWRSIQYTNLPGLIIEAIKELKRKYERILGLVKPG